MAAQGETPVPVDGGRPFGRLAAATLAMVVLTAAAVALGLWQYGAWNAHRTAVTDSLTDAAPEPLARVIGPDDPFPGDAIGQPVEVSGTWLGEGSFLVSERDGDQGRGLWVVTPLVVDGGESALPIVRGWIASAADAPANPSGAVSLTGWLQPPEGDAPEADPDPTDTVYPSLRVADLIQRLDRDAYGAYVVVGDRPGWAPAVNAGVDGLAPAELAQRPEPGRFLAIRNLFYAAEWWLFGGFVVFVWQRYCRDELRIWRARDRRLDQPRDAIG